MTTISEAGYRDDVAKLTPNLRRFARALVQDHDPEGSDELVQATLVKAVAADQPRTGVRLMIWLMSVLTGLYRSGLREAQADQKLRSGEGGRSGLSEGRVETWGTAHGSRDAALLSGIPLECREVLLLVTLEKLSYMQVAESLGLPVNTVISRLARAREYLSQAQGARTTPTARAGQTCRHPPYLRLIK